MQSNQINGAFATLVAAVALIVAVVALTVRTTARAEDGHDIDASAAPDAGPLEVSLTEFGIEPNELATPTGDVVIEVTNDGAAPHTLALDGTDDVTPVLESGEQGTLELGDLQPGSYTLVCTIPGHAGAGMTATLAVGGGAADDGHGHEPDEAMSWQEMDRVMRERTESFPAETEGVGAQPLEPEVTADGTKVFELTSSIVHWEVEPGKVVEAWTYNGTVPGPTLRADVGDRIRIVLHNELPESTAIHFHGVKTPNDMDGVPDITQQPIRPGDTFTYEFVAEEPAVGMYHSHHHADVQLPNGLAGTILIGQMDLPEGVEVTREIPMVLNDAGVIGLSLNGKSFPATAPVVLEQGERVLVHYLNEGLQSHPMHLHGLNQWIVAKDGFPLDAPQQVDTVNVAPGERYSVLVEADAPGVWAWHCHIINHAERDDGMFGMVTAAIVG